MQKGQASFEFLLVTGIAISLLIASTYFIFGYTQSGADRTALSQAAQIGYQIVDNARTVYIYGEGSFVTVLANPPEQMREIYVVDNRTLVITIQTDKGLVPVQIFSDIRINGTTVNPDMTAQIDVNRPDQPVRAGRTSYRIESQGDWVRISQQ